jgi:hypothetical protein
MGDPLPDLRAIVDGAAARLMAISEAQASRPRAPGQWSPKQIVGHLIDSAINNHGRFVRAQGQDDLLFPGYDQEAWVRVQRYDERVWTDLVHAWRIYNHQVADVMRAVPSSERDRPRPRHNLDQIGFQPLPDRAPATLGFLMRDYVAHLQHHLRQILDA